MNLRASGNRDPVPGPRGLTPFFRIGIHTLVESARTAKWEKFLQVWSDAMSESQRDRHTGKVHPDLFRAASVKIKQLLAILPAKTNTACFSFAGMCKILAVPRSGMYGQRIVPTTCKLQLGSRHAARQQQNLF
jgi:hypothetical protein